MSISNYIVGKNISYLRQRSGMTQQQLASTLGVSHQAVSKWEKGVTLPDIESMLGISRLFGVTLEQLLSSSISGSEQAESEYETPLDPVYDIAGKAVKAAQNLGESIVNGVSKALSGAEDIITGIYDAGASTQKEDTESMIINENKEGMSLKSLIDLAPFMSRDKLERELLNNSEIPTPNQLKLLAPHISNDTLEALMKRATGTIDAETLLKLAPFMKKEQLFRMLAQCPEAMNLNSLRRFAPFLKRNMVDTLLDGISKARDAIQKEEFISHAESVFDGIKQKLGDAIRSVTEPVPDDGAETTEYSDETFEEQDEVQTDSQNAHNEPIEVKVVSSELKDNIARAALAAKSWPWLKAHISEIGDRALLRDIAAAAAENTELNDLFITAVNTLESSEKNELITELISRNRYEKLIPIANMLDETAVNVIITTACGDYETNSGALDAIKTFAPRASKAKLEELIHSAVEANKWDLIEILTPYI